MFDGIYCKEKNSCSVYESILIDEFDKCMNSTSCKTFCVSRSTMDCADSKSMSETSLMVGAKYQIGMNVRAKYSVDERFYEATIVKNLSDKFVTVQFIGYCNEEVVDVNTLRPSLGEEARSEQTKQSKIDSALNLEEEYDDCEDSCLPIDWKIGMACRALYEKNDTIYEATIIEMKENEGTAILEMTGYGILFDAKLKNLYESVPEYRKKQEICAQKYNALKQTVKKSPDSKTASLSRIQPEKNSSNSSPSKIKADSNTDQVPRLHHESSPNEKVEESSDVLENALPVCSLSEGIMQPENESEALACLISANYLSGYYAAEEMAKMFLIRN